MSLDGKDIESKDFKLEENKLNLPMTQQQQFSDWFWYGNHALFEWQVKQYVSPLKERRELAKSIRKVLLVVMLCLIAFGFVNDGVVVNLTTNLMYFTVWGKYMTLVTVVLGYMLDQEDGERVAEDRSTDQAKYSPMRVWKWYCFFFQLAFVSEFTVTIFFWTLLLNTQDASSISLPKLIQLVCDHSVPMIVMIIQFCMTVAPFCWRHFPIQYMIYTFYNVVNMICTKVRGSPIYPPLDWFSKRSMIILAGMTVGGAVVFAFIKAISDLKFRLNEYQEVLDCMTQKEEKEASESKDPMDSIIEEAQPNLEPLLSERVKKELKYQESEDMSCQSNQLTSARSINEETSSLNESQTSPRLIQQTRSLGRNSPGLSNLSVDQFIRTE